VAIFTTTVSTENESTPFRRKEHLFSVSLRNDNFGRLGIWGKQAENQVKKIQPNLHFLENNCLYQGKMSERSVAPALTERTMPKTISLVMS
jgi:hypothetical protein